LEDKSHQLVKWSYFIYTSYSSSQIIFLTFSWSLW